MRMGVMEILLILVLALVLFGGKKLAGVGKSLGQSIREFKKEVSPDEKANDDLEGGLNHEVSSDAP